MKDTLKLLIASSSDEAKYSSVLNSMMLDISNNTDLENKIGEILPFLSDKDRNLRIQSMCVLSFINSQFNIVSVKKAISEMASIKLSDSACLKVSCEIISGNLDLNDENELVDIFEKLIDVDLRINLLSARIDAYKLFMKILEKNIKLEKREYVEKFKNFCGYEQDPRCLKIIFEIFPKFTKLIVHCLDNGDKAELYDVVSAFYPITKNHDLANDLSICLASNEVFKTDLAQLLVMKLKNSLSDTRTALYKSLPLLLVFKTPSELVVDIINSFILSLRDHYESGSKATEESVVNAAIDAIYNFVKINEDSWSLISSIAISEWISIEIIQSDNTSSIRAYSVVAWTLEKLIHFEKQVMAPLGAVVKNAMKACDEPRIQSIYASIIEYLKLQEESYVNDPDFDLFFTTAITNLLVENPSLKMTSVFMIHELALHFILDYNDNLIPNLLKCLKIEPFSSEAFISLSKQENYKDALQKDFLYPLINAIQENKSFYDLNSKEVLLFASKLIKSSFFSKYILATFAKIKNYSLLLKLILPFKNLDDEISSSLLESLENAPEEKDLVLAIAIRSSGKVISEHILKKNKLFYYLLASANIEYIPESVIDLSDPKTFLIYSSKTDKLQKYHPLALSLRCKFSDDFNEENIIDLLDFENQFEVAVGSTFDKIEMISKKYIYNPNYKIVLWEYFHDKLEKKPLCFLKLCLLCPPEFYLSEINKIVHLLPSFLEADIKSFLDLMIFTLVNIDSISTDFSNVLDKVVPKLILALDDKDPYVRLDTVKVLHLIPLNVPEDDCSKYKSNITRNLRRILDDNKREIRKEAAEAQLIWFKVENPVE